VSDDRRWSHRRVSPNLVNFPGKKRSEPLGCVTGSTGLSVCKINQKRVHGFGWNVACRQMSGQGTNWLTFDSDPGHSPDPGTGFLPPISYVTLLPCYSLAYISANLAYFSVISVSICGKLARSILVRDRNTAKEANFRKSLSKCRILSPKNTALLISDSPAANAAAASIDQ